MDTVTKTNLIENIVFVLRSPWEVFPAITLDVTGKPYLLIVTAAGVKFSVAALKCLPVLHPSAYYLFWSFGITELVLVCFEYTMLLKPALVGLEMLHFSVSLINALNKTSLVYSFRI